MERAALLQFQARFICIASSFRQVGGRGEDTPINELAQTLIGDSAAAPPAHILEGVAEDLAHHAVQFAPHTIYEELWHITFWQQVTLDWVNGVETPFPVHASAGFPGKGDADLEPADSYAYDSFTALSRPLLWWVMTPDSRNGFVAPHGPAIPFAS